MELSGPKAPHATESTRLSRPSGGHVGQKPHVNISSFRGSCANDTQERDREYETFRISVARSASTASRSYFSEQRVRGKLGSAATQERRVRDKSVYGPNGNRRKSRIPCFLYLQMASGPLFLEVDSLHQALRKLPP